MNDRLRPRPDLPRRVPPHRPRHRATPPPAPLVTPPAWHQPYTPPRTLWQRLTGWLTW